MHTRLSYLIRTTIAVMLLLSGTYILLKQDNKETELATVNYSEQALDKEVTTTSTTIIVTTTKATTKPRPTTTKPKITPGKIPAKQTVITGDIWWRLALCESGGTNANTGNGFYGYFQFVPSTWRSVGGTGLPTDHGYEEQRNRAQILQKKSGWGPWPGCSKKLGLR